MPDARDIVVPEAERLTVGAFPYLAFLAQGGIMGAFFLSEYDIPDTDSSAQYNFYVGVALMMFVGFGYLMTCLKQYGLGAIGFTMFIACIGVEFAIMCESLMVEKGFPIKVNMMAFMNGNFAVAAVLISFGAVI